MDAPALAQNAEPITGSAATRIEVDEDTQAVRIFIEGVERVRIDAGGLHVDGEIALMDKPKTPPTAGQSNDDSEARQQ